MAHKKAYLKRKDVEMERRYILVLEKLRQGWGNLQISRWLREEYDISSQTANKYIKNAYEYLNSNDSFKDEIKKVQQERFEYILQKAIEDSKWDTANRILDNMNKMFGLYDTSTKIEIQSDIIKFRFGGDDEPDIRLIETEDNSIQDAKIIGVSDVMNVEERT